MVSLSVSTALMSLDSTVRIMERLLYEHGRERAIRNNIIRDAADAGVRQKELIRRSKLSRQQVGNIISTPPEPVPPAWEDRT